MKQRINNTDVFWEIKEDGTLMITGDGDPCLHTVYDIPWSDNREKIKKVLMEIK